MHLNLLQSVDLNRSPSPEYLRASHLRYDSREIQVDTEDPTALF